MKQQEAIVQHVRHLYEQKKHMDPSEQDIYNKLINEPILDTTQQLKEWSKLIQPQINKAVQCTRNRARTNMNSIKTFFKSSTSPTTNRHKGQKPSTQTQTEKEHPSKTYTTNKIMTYFNYTQKKIPTDNRQIIDQTSTQQ